MNKISLIIPIYNSEKNLNTLLNNLVKQDYDDYEIIIIDDGSFDQGRKIVEEFQKKNNRIKYYYQENMGPGLARKNGFIKSTGKLIFFIDSDDYLPNTDVLKKINELYERYYFEILFFNYQLNFDKTNIIENALKSLKIKSGKYDISILKDKIEGCLWSKVFIRDMVKMDYFYDSDNFEDYYFTYKYLENCKSLVFTEDVFYISNRNNMESISKKKEINKMFKAAEICNLIYEFSKLKNSSAILITDTYIMVGRYIIKYEKNNMKKYLKKLNEIINVHKIKLKFINIKQIIKFIQIVLIKYEI